MTFRTIIRGTPRPLLCDFLCPVHGKFEALVDSGTDEAFCPAIAFNVGCSDSECCGNGPQHEGRCDLESPWTPSVIPMRMKRVEAVRGGIERPEHADWDFQRNLEDGQDPDDWQADREAAAEERRKKLVMDMVRSDR